MTVEERRLQLERLHDLLMAARHLVVEEHLLAIDVMLIDVIGEIDYLQAIIAEPGHV
jgi:hypothetical protein